MPLYEYQCQQCGRRIEKIQSFSAEPLTTCEVCGGALEKLISAPAIQFKGSGWYVTDYAKKAATGPAHKTETSSETKSETTTPAKSDSATPASAPTADSKPAKEKSA